MPGPFTYSPTGYSGVKPKPKPLTAVTSVGSNFWGGPTGRHDDIGMRASWSNGGPAGPVSPPSNAGVSIAGQPADNPYQFNYATGFQGPDANFTNTAEWLPYLIQSQLGGAASQGVNDLYGSLGDYRNARLNAITSLGPGAAQGQVQNYRQQAFAGAGDQGRQNAAALRQNGVQGADAAAALDAQNQAANATNSYSSQVYDPAAQAKRYMQQMQLSSPQAAFPLLQLIMGLDQNVQNRTNANNAQHAQSAGSGLGGIVGNILGLATGGGFGSLASLFGRGGGANMNSILDAVRAGAGVSG